MLSGIGHFLFRMRTLPAEKNAAWRNPSDAQDAGIKPGLVFNAAE
jgi:hypothetical protein